MPFMLSKTHKIITVVLIAVLLGWVSLHLVPDSELIKYSLAIILLALGAFMSPFYIKGFWGNLTPEHFFLSLLLFSSFTGSAFLTVGFGPIQLFPYRILLVGLVFLIIVKWILHGNYNLKFIKLPYIYSFFLLWIFLGITALSWSVELGEGIKEVIFLVTGILLIFLITLIFTKEKNYYEFFTIWILMGLFIVGIGLVNHFFQIHLPISRLYNGPYYQQSIPTSVFVNENDLASFLSITFFFFLSLIRNMRVPIYQVSGIVGALGSVYLILITGSRANYIAIFLGLLFWFVFLLTKQEKIKLVIIGFMFLTPVLYYFRVRFFAAWGYFYEQVSSLFEKDYSTSVDIREHLLKNAKIFIENSFGFGVGPGNVEYYMKKYPYYETYHNYNIHNWWGEIFVHYGSIIFTGYIILFFFLLYSLFQIYKVQVNMRNHFVSEALIGGMIAFIFASISPNSFIALNYNWVLIAFAVAYVNYNKGNLNFNRRKS